MTTERSGGLHVCCALLRRSPTAGSDGGLRPAQPDRRGPTGGPSLSSRAPAHGAAWNRRVSGVHPPPGQFPKNSDAPNRTFSLQIYFILKNVRKENTILFMAAVGSEPSCPK